MVIEGKGCHGKEEGVHVIATEFHCHGVDKEAEGTGQSKQVVERRRKAGTLHYMAKLS
jgi:hypothetical protein